MIEPLGSVTVLQAEPYKAQVQPTQPVETTTEGTKIDSQPMVDATTKGVESAGEKQSEGMQQELTNEQMQQAMATNEQLRKAVDDINKKMITNQNSELQFGIHEGTHRVTIKVIDRESKKVIRELPPEKTLDMIAKAWELAGILVDERR
ncbi:MAG: flagellar protein FlaG [Lachnospiraceae bacterium]|nr:flagellar protein FlaG [Lachnospiraceae bacterium]